MSKVRDQTFQIVRYADAPTLAETACMTFAPFADDVARLSQRAVAAGMDQGEHLRVLISMPGFSLTHVWFKKHYPLPLHSHDADCLYYIIAGSLRIGNETLGPRDGFFIPADMPYAYIPRGRWRGAARVPSQHAFHLRQSRQRIRFLEQSDPDGPSQCRGLEKREAPGVERWGRQRKQKRQRQREGR